MTSNKPKLIYLLSLADRKLQLWIKKNRPKELPSITQSGVIFLLSKQDGLLMNEIAKQLNLVPSAVSTLIQRMQDGGFVFSAICQQDARATRIYLTEHSKSLLPALLTQTQLLNEQLYVDFSDEEIEIVERWLHTLIQKFSSHDK